ncbi:hypothetical protein CTI12_AA536250 [Artemisia annua]|uniref:Uncharacterized protein n=1 Tax=Artemisia annua TaxID=35608 RepID=A0A2U1L2N9_ARTAN|nr:hypothetical protein CTI12_AA536250 [Artemisia annua]
MVVFEEKRKWCHRWILELLFEILARIWGLGVSTAAFDLWIWGLDCLFHQKRKTNLLCCVTVHRRLVYVPKAILANSK